jgi:hypothetical protein
MLLAPVTDWEPHGVTLAGYAMRLGVQVQIVTPYRVSHCSVTGRGNVTSVYPPSDVWVVSRVNMGDQGTLFTGFLTLPVL